MHIFILTARVVSKLFAMQGRFRFSLETIFYIFFFFGTDRATLASSLHLSPGCVVYGVKVILFRDPASNPDDRKPESGTGLQVEQDLSLSVGDLDGILLVQLCSGNAFEILKINKHFRGNVQPHAKNVFYSCKIYHRKNYV